MNVLQLISSSDGYYGAERVCVTLAGALREFGVTSVVSAFRNGHKEAHLEVLDRAGRVGLITEEIACNGRVDWSAVTELRRLIDRHKIDIIHCHNIKPNLYAVLATRGRPVGLVSTCHSWHVTSPMSWLLSALDRCILRAADRVVLVSEHLQPAVRRYGLQTIVIHNGIDLEPFSNVASDLRERMNWSDRTIIASISRLCPAKGVHSLLQVAPSILQRHPRALFVFAGDGPARQDLEAQATALGIRESVCFLGFREDIPELLSSVDILAIASVSEGLPMVLLEAMACSVGVVASSVGAIPQVIRNQVNGILIPPSDRSALTEALLGLVECRELRRSLGRKARETVEARFSAASMARQYLQVYQEITR